MVNPVVTSPRSIRWKTGAAVAIGNFMEWFDFAVYGFFAASIGKLFFPNGNPAVSLLSSLAVFGVAFFMRPIGGLVLGSIADRKGRRWSLTVTVLMMGVTTTLVGALPTFGQVGVLAPVLLVIIRCLQGFSAGGEWTGSSAFLVEMVPTDRRGLFGSIISATAALATIAGGLIALGLTSWLSDAQLLSWGWRLPFLLAAPIALVGLYVRLRLAETPVFESIRAHREVESKPVRAGTKRDFRAILLSFFFASVQGLGFYYLATYVVTYLGETVHLKQATALLLTAIGLALYALLCPLAGLAADRFGRRPVNILGSAGLALFVFPAFLLMSTGNSAAVVFGFFVFAVFQSMVSVTTVVLLTELFPAATRGSSSAIGFNLGLAIVGGPGPFVAEAIAEASSNKAMPAIYMVGIAVIGFVIVLRWLPETRGRDLRSTRGALGERTPAAPASSWLNRQSTEYR
ncbi:MAG TPA: MFS transporter [Pseudonocardiaceae bacterium]|nr:MFS transporter [Pseudonocardiaceae bacterium]